MYKIYKQRVLLSLSIIVLVALSGCKINYSFTGASIGADVKTVFVDFFQNRAKLVSPTLSQTFTEAMKDKFSNELGLTLTNSSGDLEFSGQITQYYTKPMAVKQSDDGVDYASQNRFTMGVKVRFVNNRDHEQDFESTFSAYTEYDSSQSFDAVESSLVEIVMKDIIEDIFSESVANW